jgi:hypothetical protein
VHNLFGVHSDFFLHGEGCEQGVVIFLDIGILVLIGFSTRQLWKELSFDWLISTPMSDLQAKNLMWPAAVNRYHHE